MLDSPPANALLLFLLYSPLLFVFHSNPFGLYEKHLILKPFCLEQNPKGFNEKPKRIGNESRAGTDAWAIEIAWGEFITTIVIKPANLRSSAGSSVEGENEHGEHSFVVLYFKLFSS